MVIMGPTPEMIRNLDRIIEKMRGIEDLLLVY